jgi:hypothetical protein
LPSNTVLDFQRKRFLPGADEEIKAKIDAVIAQLKKKFGEVRFDRSVRNQKYEVIN